MYQTNYNRGNDTATTQVLNLNAVEQAAKYEKSQSIRPILMLMFAGIFAIAMGVLYPKIMSAIDGDEENTTASATPTTTTSATTTASPTTTPINLICNYSAVADAEGVTSNITITFNFIDSKLQSYTKIGATTPTVGKETLGTTTINNLLTNYKTIAATTLAGYTLTASTTGTTLNTSLTVDLTKLDKAIIPTTYANDTFTAVNYDKDATLDTVKTATTALGYTCE